MVKSIESAVGEHNNNAKQAASRHVVDKAKDGAASRQVVDKDTGETVLDEPLADVKKNAPAKVEDVAALNNDVAKDQDPTQKAEALANKKWAAKENHGEDEAAAGEGKPDTETGDNEADPMGDADVEDIIHYRPKC